MCADRSLQGSGFTLLEVVVALAIAGLALVGLFRAGSGGLLAVDTAARAEEAVQRAQSHLAAVGRDAALVEGRYGVVEIIPGDLVPGLGRIQEIKRQDGRWVVVTSRGLITSR